MHILYLIDSLARGGAERSLAGLAGPYVARGARLDVAYLHERSGFQEEIQRGGARLFSLAGPGGRLAWLLRVLSLVRRQRPDLIHTTLFESDVVGRIVGGVTGTPVVSSLVNVAYGREQLEDPQLRRWKVRGAQFADMVTARQVVRFHALTGHVASLMSGRLRIPRGRIDVIPRARDPQRLGEKSERRRTRVRSMLGVDDATPVVLAAARQERQKGLDVLLQAFASVLQEFPKATLIVSGRSGAHTHVLEEITARNRLDGAVRFLGSRSDVPDLMCSADVFVAPSRWEGFGGVLLEAMALEAPIVATDLPPFREFLDDGDMALFVPPERPEIMADAIVATLSDPSAAARRAASARECFMQQFTIDAVADRMMAFYDRALTGTRSGVT